MIKSEGVKLDNGKIQADSPKLRLIGDEIDRDELVKMITSPDCTFNKLRRIDDGAKLMDCMRWGAERARRANPKLANATMASLEAMADLNLDEIHQVLELLNELNNTAIALLIEGNIA